MFIRHNFQFDTLTSPLFKKSWLDPPQKHAPDIELASLNDGKYYTYPPRGSDNIWESNEHLMLDLQPFKESFNNQITEMTLANQTDLERKENEDNVHLDNKLKMQPSGKSYDFNLEKDVKRDLMESDDYTDFERRRYLGMLNSKLKKPASLNKLESVQRYLDKKKRRKFVGQIKYKVRQDLACRRLRVKGKFAKSSKMDLVTAAGILLTRFLIRRTSGTASESSSEG